MAKAKSSEIPEEVVFDDLEKGLARRMEFTLEYIVVSIRGDCHGGNERSR
jgi:hypothetical protein